MLSPAIDLAEAESASFPWPRIEESEIRSTNLVQHTHCKLQCTSDMCAAVSRVPDRGGWVRSPWDRIVGRVLARSLAPAAAQRHPASGVSLSYACIPSICPGTPYGHHNGQASTASDDGSLASLANDLGQVRGRRLTAGCRKLFSIPTS